MRYAYEGTIEKLEGDWVVSVPAFPGCFGGGRTVRKACTEAAEALKLFIAMTIDEGKKLPRATFHNPPRIVLCVEIDQLYIDDSRCYTYHQAAKELDVTLGRITQLVKKGALEGVIVGGKKRITIASVNDRRFNHPGFGRPRKTEE